MPSSKWDPISKSLGREGVPPVNRPAHEADVLVVKARADPGGGGEKVARQELPQLGEAVGAELLLEEVFRAQGSGGRGFPPSVATVARARVSAPRPLPWSWCARSICYSLKRPNFLKMHLCIVLQSRSSLEGMRTLGVARRTERSCGRRGRGVSTGFKSPIVDRIS